MINFEAFLANPNVQAFLRAIREGESSQDDAAYTTLFGGGRFIDTSKHPNVAVTANGYTSTAAGAYQFLYKTWQGLVEQYSFPDFGPHSQDCGAVALIAGRGALDDVQAGRFDEAVRKCGKEWASLPGSPYGQPTRDLSTLRKVYGRYGGVYAAADVQPQILTDTSDKPAPIVESKPVFERKPTVEPLTILSFGIQALSKIVPAISQMFPGSEVSERNAKAATVLLEAAKDSIGAVNTQDLVSKIEADPTTKSAITDAIATLVEVGGGIPAAATRAVEMQKTGPLYSNPAFVITCLLLVPVYAFFASVLGVLPGTVTWDDNVRMLVAGVISNVISGAMGFWLGSSFGSQKKTDVLAK